MKITPEFPFILTPPGMPPQLSNMKINGIYMLLSNMNVEHHFLCNGSRFILQGLNTISAQWAHDPRWPNSPLAMTINKSYWGTFKGIGLDVSTTVFEHGQLYVAFSLVPDIISWQFWSSWSPSFHAIQHALQHRYSLCCCSGLGQAYLETQTYSSASVLSSQI